jgi:hypothetical protein
MNFTYSQIKASLDSLIKNNPLTKIRGAIVNDFFTKVLQFARDSILGIPVATPTSAEDGMLAYYDLATDTFKWKAVTGGTGSDDHDLLTHIGINTHYDLDGWIAKGSDLTVSSSLSLAIAGKERNFSVNGSGTNHLNGLVFEDTEAAGWIVKLKFNDVVTIENGTAIQGGSSFALSCGTDFVTTQNDILVFLLKVNF